MRRACKLKCPGFGVRTFNNTGNCSLALSNTYAGRVVSCNDCIPNRPADSGHLKTQTRRANPGKPGQCGQAPPDDEPCL
ncbi:hypothetical protein DW233_09010 [Collinsella sp. AM20-15AC]|nr:hypothetical protein DW233_09010 [Collinsella sp. AM20-15AC]